ncbi:formate/nitrite transporter family protein [Roseicella frigidaeris]|uniref:Formate/nitrite transporter family protein n=1 Tax=Roseicella frigidaeris TaxID=2230885 RepID=A0A327M933_9PROT|nr:formate/nitrite transporter family protein [Roseicella frigidaeris]RAI59801.1 formate/nitrite transporter family protein [Roseicella frigidaeris]
MPDAGRRDLTAKEQEDVTERAAPRSPVIYHVVRRQGEEELARPVRSLAWSGLAGGVTIMASVIAEGALHHKLPAGAAWREPVADLGYTLGFLMVILGRMQLFTEQTIVSVLPVMAAPDWRKLGATARLWAVVFAANMVGAAAAAAINLHLHLVSAPLRGAMLEVSGQLLLKTPLELLLQGVPAGFLIASVAWLRAGSPGSEFLIVLALTYAIALGDFTHVVAGAAEAFLLVFDGQLTATHAVVFVIIPALIGNLVGGTGLFALLAHAQVRDEI